MAALHTPSSPSSSPAEALKRMAAAEALERVRSGMRLGLGTGSTMAHFVELLGAKLSRGEVRDVVGVPTSRRTEAAARDAGIPLQELHQAEPLDLAVDGADEVDPRLHLVKGLGGALLREKMVVQAAERFVVVVDEGKRVDRLGTRNPLPVEVVPFGWQTHVSWLAEQGVRARLRWTDDDGPYTTDNGNHVLDLSFEDGIVDPGALERRLRRRAGIVETGLFLGVASEVIVAGSDGVTVLVRGGA
jgi:ribose 5-phosphate isomerase A